MVDIRDGARPVGLFGRYGPDTAHLAEYARLAKTDAGFQQYLDEYVRDRASAA